MRSRVGIFGGSFNPVHSGHVSIARAFLDSHLIHQLWIIPAADPPHKSSGSVAPFADRIEMLKIAFQKDSDVRIWDIEVRLPSPSYTVRTLEYLQSRDPDTLFYLCMGEDSLAGIELWYHYREILDRITLIVAERPGIDRDQIPDEIKEKVVFVANLPVDVSSTDIRNHKAADHTPAGVWSYMREKRLYHFNSETGQ